MSVAPDPVETSGFGWQALVELYWRYWYRFQAERPLAVIPALFRALDTPWLLLPVTAVVLELLEQYVPGNTVHRGLLLAAAIWIGARRWGLDAVRPTLLLCLLEIVSIPQIRWHGDLWDIPVMLAACRFGAEPSALATLASRGRLAWADLLLIGTFLLSPSVGIFGFRPEVEFWLEPGGLALLLLFGIAGASAVPFRTVGPLIVLGVAAYWLLAPFRPYDGLEQYLTYRFGITPIDGLECCLAFAAGRALTRDGTNMLAEASMASLVWVAMLVVAVAAIEVRVPYGPFGWDSVSLLSRNATESSHLNFTTFTLVTPELLALQAIIVVRFAGQLHLVRRKWLEATFFLSMLAMAGAAIPIAVLMAQLLPTAEETRASWAVIVPFREVLDSVVVAKRAAAFTLQSLLIAFLVVWATPRAPAPITSRNGEGSLVFELYGRIWPLAVPAQFFLLAALSLGIAIGKAPPVEELANEMSADLNSAEDNSADNIGAAAEAAGNAVEAAVDAAGSSPPSRPKDRRSRRSEQQDSFSNVVDVSDIPAVNSASAEYLTSEQRRGEQTTMNAAR